MNNDARTEQVGSHRVDKQTGEVYGVFLHTAGVGADHAQATEPKPLKGRGKQFDEWANKTRTSDRMPADFKTVQRAMIASGEESAPEVPSAKNPKGAGRKPTVYINPVSHLIVYMIERKFEWFDNIVWGSCITSGGESGGKMNVRAGNVLSALYLKEISAKSCQFQGDSPRKGRLVAQAARNAAHGIAMYLVGQPALLDELEAQAAIEARLAYCAIDTPIEVPTTVQEWYATQHKPTLEETIAKINADFDERPGELPVPQPYTFAEWAENRTQKAKKPVDEQLDSQDEWIDNELGVTE